ncbi:MAG TPA: nucleotide sugar dehydrogenase [Patescibacteria group bacterium]|nr:nucleotide sugar dehydrogenase [Patescibacteria group bacterium]
MKQISKKRQNVVIMGLGYVGSALTEAIIKNKKYHLIGFDIDPEKTQNLEKKFKNQNFETTTDDEVLEKANIIIISVPTPVYIDYTPNLTPLKNVSKSIAKHLQPKQLIILESTVNPGASEEVIIPIIESSGYKVGEDFYYAHCPERIDPGNTKWTIHNIPRVVGGINTKSRDLAYKFYSNIISAQIYKTKGIKEAEATKIVENTFRDINIAYVNELARSFDTLGIDVLEVIKGASTKPFAFLPHYPSCGVGGHCIGVDPYYLIQKAAKVGFNHRFLKLARKINNSMPSYTVQQLSILLKKQNKKLNQVKVGVLGLSYKKGVGDLRQSPALKIVQILKQKKIRFETFDPYVPEISTCKSLAEILKKSQAVILATDHDEFINIKPETWQRNKIIAIVDGKNSLGKNKIQQLGIPYKGIGR